MQLAILDRDGTLNALGDGVITTPEDWVALPGALEAIARLNQAGWRVAVVTNQPGLGRGLLDAQTLAAIHAKLQRQLAAVGGRIDAFFYCPHADDEACACRMPQPGLMQQIRERYGLEGAQMLVAASAPAPLQAAAGLGAALHMVCSGASAEVDPGAPLPPAWPAGTRAHASLQALVDAVTAP
ncbi:HAD-IIIA family hydrolase [Comamonas faecalis]